jgi:hypothetical protein
VELVEVFAVELDVLFAEIPGPTGTNQNVVVINILVLLVNWRRFHSVTAAQLKHTLWVSAKMYMHTALSMLQNKFL